MDWLPPEIRLSSKWTEIVEFCDWDEEAAALLVEQVRAGLPPMPPQSILKLIKEIDFILSQKEKAQEVGEA
jgi:hypothetical protein